MRAWRRRFTKTASRHVLAVRVYGWVDARVPCHGSQQKPQDHQILRLFIGDAPTRALIDDDAINRA
jgi:hypothetical protein